jgi:hypothetical protein
MAEYPYGASEVAKISVTTDVLVLGDDPCWLSAKRRCTCVHAKISGPKEFWVCGNDPGNWTMKGYFPLPNPLPIPGEAVN